MDITSTYTGVDCFWVFPKSKIEGIMKQGEHITLLLQSDNSKFC